MKIKLLLIITLLMLMGCTGPGHRSMNNQFQIDHAGPVYSIQGYVITGSLDHLQEAWQELGNEMKKQDGFLSSRLSEGVGDSPLVLVHSEWTSL